MVQLERHGAVAADSAERGAYACDAAAGAGRNDGTERFSADGEADRGRRTLAEADPAEDPLEDCE